MDGIIDILEKRDNVGYADSLEKPEHWQWHFLQVMNEALCSFRAHECASAGSTPCTRQILLGQPERDKQLHWADLKDEGQVRIVVHGHKYGDVYSAIISSHLVSLSMNTVDYFLLLYASLFCLCLAQVIFYATQAVRLMCCSRLMVKIFTVDNYKTRTAQNLGAPTCPTAVIPRYDADPFSDGMRREISLITSVEVLQC